MSKNIIDAVNELKGEITTWGGGFYINYGCKLFLIESTFRSKGFVCTTDEFLATVAECETNFGKCGRGEWFHYVNGSKLLLTKDLDKELDAMENLIGKVKELSAWGKIKGSFGEGVIYLCTKGDDIHTDGGVYFTGKKYVCNGHGIVDEHDDGSKLSVCASGWSEFKLISLPVNSTPIYTQEDADSGVFPSVGMECEFITTFFTHEPSNNGTGTPIAYHDNKVWFSTGSKEFVINLNVITFKPLTTPITLIDGECYQGIHKGNGKLYKGVYVKSTDEIFHCKCSNPASFYTNIQLLTVEVK